MAGKNDLTSVAELAASIEKELASKHGPKIHGKPLLDILGYSSSASLRQAERGGRITVHLFTPEKRRGRWALTRDVARWLAEQSLQGGES